jgi:SAM-dependent methyltransferase
MCAVHRANQALWDEWVKINAASKMYDLASFKTGRSSLHELELTELGEVDGRSLLHLQCHFGMDSLSWARCGAQVTGIDFSEEGIALARSLSAELDIPARFVCSDLYDLPHHLEGQFDIVYTSYGVLTWLSDLNRWAKIVAHFLKPGGVFYIAEFHPFAMVFDEQAPELRLRYPYTSPEAMVFEVQGSYADTAAEVKETHTYEWTYPLGEVVSALCAAGLRIQFLHEFPYTSWAMLPFLEQHEDGNYYVPGKEYTIPLMFSIRAIKD